MVNDRLRIETIRGIELLSLIAIAKRASDNDHEPNDHVPPEKTGGTSNDARIVEPNDWRGAMLARIHGLTNQTDPEVIVEWKLRRVPV